MQRNSGGIVNEEQTTPLDPAAVAALYVEHAEELGRFLRGLVRDAHLASDLLQSTFARALEVGHTSRAQSRKGWLFRVAYHEAMAVLRRNNLGQRVLRKAAWEHEEHVVRAEEPIVRYETVAAVRAAVGELPAEQQQVVRMRMYEEKTFAAIAEELNIPLGTALGRMRLALEKIRKHLEPPS